MQQVHDLRLVVKSVGDGQHRPSRADHMAQLPDSQGDIRHVIEHVRSDGRVECPRPQGQRLCICADQWHSFRPGLGQHPHGQVDGDDFCTSRLEVGDVGTETATEIEDPVADLPAMLVKIHPTKSKVGCCQL